jgi:hypothetical protein
MPAEAARKDLKSDLVARLADCGDELADPVARVIRDLGSGPIPALVEILEDDELARSDAPGGGHVPIHAATLLADLRATAAIEPMLRVLARCDAMEALYSPLVFALQSFGPLALEPALVAHAAARSKDQRMSVAEVLSGLHARHARDDRIFQILLRTLGEDVELGAGALAEYGDPAALPYLGAVLDACEVDLEGGLLANQDVVEIEAAIEELGGSLSVRQRAKVRAVQAAREAARASLPAIGAPDADDGDEGDEGDADEGPDDEGEREDVLRRFAESSHGRGFDPWWAEMALEYGARYEGVRFSDFDAEALGEVVYDHFPRKVSCEPSAAPEIVRSLRAFWTFARDVLGHRHAEECLEDLGDDVIPVLRDKLDDPSNFGMAKAIVMAGRRRGFRVETEEGMRQWTAVLNAEMAAPNGLGAPVHRKRDDRSKDKKRRLRKLRKRARRRNRR